MSCVGKEGFPSIQSRLQSSKEDGGSKDVGARTGVTRWGFREAHVVVFKSFLKAVGLEVDSEESIIFWFKFKISKYIPLVLTTCLENSLWL